ncbi:MAG TPA: STAS domain-containing protein [Candidatus Polarisedimenticolia bacterium]|jgi:anti-sigma B factor antagonist|nr:STAS domain-containing protein [Candidatus Polarisedimenticolia bacterium]
MKTKVRMAGKVAVVDLSGKITIGEGDVVLREEVNKLLEGDVKSILLNLNGVTYMDSAGIGELVACYKRAAETGAKLKLLNPSGRVSDLLSLTKLQQVFDIYNEEKEALATF